MGGSDPRGPPPRTMSEMREPWVLLGAGVAAALAAACEERVRECGGGFEVVLTLEDVDALDVAGADLRFSLSVDSQKYERVFPTSALGSGSTSFTVDLDNPEPASVVVSAVVIYAGPGVYSEEVVWLEGDGAIELPVATRGCLALPVLLTTAADRDGDRVPDVIDLCPDDGDPTQVDGDGDLVGDACDGCPSITNADQRDGDLDGTQDVCDACPLLANHPPGDEDGDLVPNACDPCPHLAGDRADGDSDGVGDACDPRPTAGGDSIALFLDFSDPAQAVELRKKGMGTMTIESGQLVIDSVLATAVVIPRVLSTSGVVWTRVHPSPNTTQYPWGAGTIAWVDPDLLPDADPEGVACMTHNSLVFAADWPPFIAPVLPTIHDPDVLIRWSFIDEGSINPTIALGQCHHDAMMQGHDHTFSASIFAGFGVIAHSAVARFDYLLLVDSP